MPDTNAVPIQCPNCGAQFQTPLRSVIDVGQQPELRQAFLAGQVNLAVCPKCGTGGILEVPLVYHDPAAEFLAVYFPQQLNIPELEKQKMIGELTQALMRSLPADQRKGYFLNPRQFANRQSLMDAVLGTMGISQEELDRQRKKMKLVEQLMVMADDPKGLQMMMKGNDAQFDMEFFSILSGMKQQAATAGDQKSAERLELLETNLMPQTTFGKQVLKQRAAVEALREVQSPEQLLDIVAASDLDVLPALAVSARPLFDYAFFQKLSERIHAASGAERERLTRVRERMLEVTRQLDEAAREDIHQALELLQEIINSPSPRTAVRERIAEIDDLFMNVLAMNMQQADQRKDEALRNRLEMVYDEIMTMVEESMPPEVQLINELLATPYPDDTRALLKEHQAELTPEVLDLMGRMADSMAAQEGANAAETAKRLRDIRAQAMLMV